MEGGEEYGGVSMYVLELETMVSDPPLCPFFIRASLVPETTASMIGPRYMGIYGLGWFRAVAIRCRKKLKLMSTKAQ